MGNKISVIKREEWRQIILEHRDSKLRCKEFCQSKNINLHNFYNWRSKLNKTRSVQSTRSKNRVSNFVPIKIDGTSEIPPIQTSRQLPDAKWAAEFAAHFVRSLL